MTYARAYVRHNPVTKNTETVKKPVGNNNENKNARRTSRESKNQSFRKLRKQRRFRGTIRDDDSSWIPKIPVTLLNSCGLPVAQA